VNALKTGEEFTVEVTAGMGVPSFTPKSVKLASGDLIAGIEVSTGNPHFDIVVDNADSPSPDCPGRPSAPRSARIRFSSPDQRRIPAHRQSR